MAPRAAIGLSFCVVTLVSVLPCSTRVAAAPAPDQAKLGHLIDETVSQVQACKGLAIGIQGNGVRAQRFYGTTGNNGVPGSDTEFEVASITKTFTGTLLAWADQQGKMRIDDPLSKYAPPGARIPTYNGEPIRLLHLADHTSGLPRKMPTPGPHLFPPAVWAFLSNYQLTRAPGERFLYSNLGVGTLGLALARANGERFEPLLSRVITTPLGLRDSVITLSSAQHARLAQGYGPKGRLAPQNERGFPALAGAGAMYSTLRDMMRYLDFQLGEIDSPLKSLLPVVHQVRHAAGPHGSVGLGWQMRRLSNGVEIVDKDGARPGFSSFIVFAPSTHTGAVILANQGRCPVQKMGAQLINALNKAGGPPPELPPSEDED